MNALRFLQQNAPFLGAGVLLTFLSSFGQTFFISIFAGEIRADFGLSHGAWGGIYALSTTASAVVMVWAGALTDRFRTRALGALVLILLAATCLLMAGNRLAWLLPLTIFLLRFAGQGMTGHLSMVSMSRWFVASRGKALATSRLGFAFGEAVMPVTIVAAMTVFDWRWIWVLAAVVCLSAIPLLWKLLRLEREPRSHAAEDRSVGLDGRNWKRTEVLRHWLFWFVIPALIGHAAFGTAFFFQQVEFASVKGWSHLELVALFPLYTAVTVIGMVASGVALDRFGTGRLMALSLLPMIAAFVLFALGESLWAAMLGLVFLATTGGAFGTLPAAFWAEYYGTRHLGAIKALAVALMVFGTALGPGLTGVLIDMGIGLETQYLWVAGYFAIAAALVAVGVHRAQPRLPART